MDNFFEWVSNNPIVTTMLVVAFGVLISASILMYLVAFFQGRAISFWPPKIGSRPLNEKPEKATSSLEDKNELLQTMPLDASGNLDMLNKTGIVKVFTNLTDCMDEMMTDFKNSSDTRLLLQIGRRELGGGVSSMFYSYARQKNQPGTQLRILRAANDSPFLSRVRTNRRGRTTYDEIQDELNRLHEIISRLQNLYHVKIDEREHREPYLWRIFVFDNIAYVSGYLYKSGNDNMAVVYKIKDGKDSIYAIFDKYFEYLWKKYEPNADAASDKHWIDWE